MPTLSTVARFVQRHPEAFTEASVRFLIYQAQERERSVGGSVGGKRQKIPGNGFGPAFIRQGRRVLIDEERFFEILREKSASVAACMGNG